MAKPRPTRIQSDSCPVRIDGAVSYPHEGEWVELVPIETIGELRARVQFGELGAKLEALKDDEDQGRKFNVLLDSHYEALCRYLARRVRAWSWTDDMGVALAQPDGTAAPLMALRADELFWLMNATGNQETEPERKND